MLARNNEAASREQWSGYLNVLKYNIHVCIPLPPSPSNKDNTGSCQLSSQTTVHWKAVCNYSNYTVLNWSRIEECEQLQHEEATYAESEVQLKPQPVAPILLSRSLNINTMDFTASQRM